MKITKKSEYQLDFTQEDVDKLYYALRELDNYTILSETVEKIKNSLADFAGGS